MTLEDLDTYRLLRKEIESIKEEIADLEFPLFSGAEKTGSRPSGVSDPTKYAAFKISEKKQKLDAKAALYYRMGEEIEQWLDTVERPEIRAIVRLRFILGHKWKETSRRVYGPHASKDLAQVNLRRFFNL